MRAAPVAAATQRASPVSPFPSIPQTNRTEPNSEPIGPNRTEPNRLSPLANPPLPPPTPNRDSDIWAIYARLCIHDTLDHIENATLVVDPDIESLNPGYAQPAYR